MAKFGRQLTHLNVGGCLIDENCLKIIVKGAQHLKYLNIENNFCKLQGECLNSISHHINHFVADYNQNVRTIEGLIRGSGQFISHLQLNVGHCRSPSYPYKLIGKLKILFAVNFLLF